MVFEKKQLSKVLAIALMIACAVAFMPLLNGQAFAAAKKPGKTSIKSAKQVTNTMNVKVTWKKASNANKYQVKIGNKTYTTKKKNYTAKNLAAGTYKVKVRGVNGKKKGAWSATKKVKVADVQAAAAVITGNANVGSILTATVTNKAGEELTEGVKYQWYRVSNLTNVETPIAGETGAKYVVQKGDATTPFSIFVEVTAGGKTVRSEKTATVSNLRALAGVSIVLPNDHVAPQLGDTLTLKITDAIGEEVTGGVNIQWFIGGKEAGNDAELVIPEKNTHKAYVGKVVTVTVTAPEGSELYTGEVVSLATLPIIESTVPEDVTVKPSAAAPFVGETLKAEFVPEGTFDDEATYQWFRGNDAIAGATSAEYTVTSSDVGSFLTVKVTLSIKGDDGKAIVLDPYTIPEKVEKALSKDATITVEACDWDNAEKKYVPAKAYTTSGYAVATVLDGDTAKTDLTEDCTYKWYIDSVADENQLFEEPLDPRVEDAEQPAADWNDLDLGDDYYLAGVVSWDDTVDLVGHKLIAVASTKAGKTHGQGTLTSEPTAAVQILLKKQYLDFDGYGKNEQGKFVAEKSTMVAEWDEYDEDVFPTVTYKWFRTKDQPIEGKHDKSEWTEIEGATASSYTLTSADVDATGIKVEATGTGDWYGTVKAILGEEVGTPFPVVANSESQKITVNTLINEEAGTAIAVQPGDLLLAGVDVPTAAALNPTYTWTYKSGEAGAKDVTWTEPSYTVPADAPAGATVELTAAFGVADYVMGTAAKATVKSELKSVEIQSYATKAKTTVDPGHDGVAYPNVGEKLKAVVTPQAAVDSDGVAYQWYADGEKIKNADDPEFRISVDEFGKTITVEATGKDGKDYAGATVTSKATGVVSAVGALHVYPESGIELTPATPVKVGETVKAKVNAWIYVGGELKQTRRDITELAAISWSVDGAGVATGDEYTFVADDEGFAWACDATGIEEASEGALTFANNLAVQPADTECKPVGLTSTDVVFGTMGQGTTQGSFRYEMSRSTAIAEGGIYYVDQYGQTLEEPSVTADDLTPDKDKTSVVQKMNDDGVFVDAELGADYTWSTSSDSQNAVKFQSEGLYKVTYDNEEFDPVVVEVVVIDPRHGD